MRRNLGIAIATVLGVACSQISFGQLTLTQRHVSNSGQEMYAAWCTACHGHEGKGDGFAGTGLTKAPPDLTMLAAAAGGKYPATAVGMTIRDGTKLMPGFGVMMERMSAGSPGEAQLRLHNLVDYVRTLQK